MTEVRVTSNMLPYYRILFVSLYY